VVALAADLTAWIQMLALTGHPARTWDPKRLRLRVFSAAGGQAAADAGHMDGRFELGLRPAFGYRQDESLPNRPRGHGDERLPWRLSYRGWVVRLGARWPTDGDRRSVVPPGPRPPG
jgi:hypothetical protein